VKITDSTVIRTGERELIDAIIGELDWGIIEKIFREKHRLRIQDDVEYRQGDLVVYNDQVAYKLDFDVKVTLSVLFDRAGNFLSLSAESLPASEKESIDQPPQQEPGQTTDTGSGMDRMDKHPWPEPIYAEPAKPPDENVTAMASQIAEMISEINEENDAVNSD